VAVLIDTTALPEEHRDEAWVDAHAQALFPLSISLGAGGPARGRIDAQPLGSLDLLRFRGAASVVARTAAGIGRDDPERCQAMLVLRGPCSIEQGDRAAELRPGDLAVFDSSRPFRVPHRETFDILLLSVPRAVLPLPARARPQVRVPAASGTGVVAGRLLVDLWEQLDRGSLSPADANMQDAVLAVSRALHREPGAAVPAPTLAQIKTHAERRLGDAALGPAGLAAAHHVSLRRLHAMFAAEGETVAGWIRGRRLERVMRDLRDPELAHLSVARIGAEHGIANASQLSRAFRREFGCSPRDVRG
jgi:AraC-like DNA-binding protein